MNIFCSIAALKKRNHWCLLFCAVLLFPVLMANSYANPISLKQFAPNLVLSKYVYSVNVECSTNNLPVQLKFKNLLEGDAKNENKTTIKIHNPLNRAVNIKYRAVQAKTQQSLGDVYENSSETIDPYSARSFECGDFITMQQRPSNNNLLPATNGLVIIESTSKVQVVATYEKRAVKEALSDNTTARRSIAALKNIFTGRDTPKQEGVVIQPLPEDELQFAGDDVGELEEVPVTIIQHGPQGGRVGAAGLGIGLGYGIGRGTGVGIGLGVSIDVEYIQPIIDNPLIRKTI